MTGAQGIDEHMINVQCYYYTHLGAGIAQWLEHRTRD